VYYVTEFLRIVPNEIDLAREISFHDFIRFVPKLRKIANPYRGFAFLLFVFLSEFVADSSIVRDYEVDHSFACVFLDYVHEVRDREAGRFAMLGHDVADVDDLGRRLPECFLHSFCQEVRYDAGIQVARTDDHIVGIDDRFTGAWIEFAASGEIGVRDHEIRIVLRYVDIGLSVDRFPVFESNHQLRIVEGYGDDFARYVEHLAEYPDSLLEISGHLREPREQEVPERMPLDPALLLESVIEHATHHFGIFRKRGNSPPRVSRRQDSEFVPEFSGTSSGVAHGNDCGEVEVGGLLLYFLKSGEQVHAPGSATYGNYVDRHLIFH
jgi:hypothetical protein